MKKLLIPLAVLCFSPASWADQFTIDPNHTFPYFTISHLGFSTMHGRFNHTTGSIEMDTARKTGKVNIHIDAASVDTGMQKRDEHLRSPDFFNAAEFPDITYTSDKVVFLDHNRARVEGKLNMLGVSKKVTLAVSRIHCGIHPMDPTKTKYVCGFDAHAKIKRSDFGITYGVPAIGDVVNISFEVEAVRQ